MKRSERDDDIDSNKNGEYDQSRDKNQGSDSEYVKNKIKKQKIRKENSLCDVDKLIQQSDQSKWNPGFLVSTPLRGKEMMAGHEFVRMVNEFAMDDIEKKKLIQSSTNKTSVSDIISSQVTHILSKSEDMIVNNIGTVGMCLVRSKTKDIDTVSIVSKIIKSLSSSEKDSFIPKYCTKVSPLQHVCIAKVDAISNIAIPIIKQHFKDCSASSFAIVLRERMTAEMDKNELKKVLATAVHEVAPNIKVDLKDPETIILVEVVKSIAGISIIDDFRSLFNLNLKTAATSTSA